MLARVLPGWIFNVALFVHGEEALLAVGFIFDVHFFNGHLRPEKFPMDTVIFTGRVPSTSCATSGAGEYDATREGGARHAVAVAALRRVRIGRAIGTIVGNHRHCGR